MKKIIPIIMITILAMAGCHWAKVVPEGEKNVAINSTEDINWNDSFIVDYRQLVNGYQVKVVVKPAPSDVMIMQADIAFVKDGKSFTLHTSCFGDTLFCKGRLDYEFDNPKLFNKNKHTIIEADYHVYKEEDHMMPFYTPFFFLDLDFDGVEELVIVHHSMAVRYHDGYDVYRIVDGEPFLIDYPPYKNGGDDDFGMTDYPEFDFKKKTISCPYPEGELKWEGRIIYGISKRKKDIVNVNGRKHYFNHIEKIKEIKFDD